MEISFYLPQYWTGLITGCCSSLFLVVVTVVFAATISVRSDKKKGKSGKKQ